MFVVFVATSLAFLLLKLAPGDPFSRFAEMEGVGPQLAAYWRHEYRLDEPIVVQYLQWLKLAATGNLGRSFSQSENVSAAIAHALPNTLLLMGLAFVSSVVLGVAIGAWQGAHSNTRRDKLFSHATLLIYSVPEFALAMLLLIVCSALFGMSIGGASDSMYDYMTNAERVRDRLSRLALPWLTLTLVGTAVFARYQRAAMREVVNEPFVRTARSKGVTEHAVLRRHALRAALLPVISMGGLLFPTLVAGAVFVEKIYSWPGMGRLVIDALNTRDYPLASGAIIIISAMTALGSIVADVLYEFADPRLRA